jgi:hypothetical protein
MKPVTILWYGILIGFFLGFSVSVFQSYIDHVTTEIAWSLLRSGLFFFFIKYITDKVDKEPTLSRIESILLIGNLLIFMFASVSVLATFSKYWFADDIKFPNIALGLSNLIAIIYWNAIRNKKIDIMHTDIKL